MPFDGTGQFASAPDLLTHITLSTGHVSRSLRDAVSDRVVRMLRRVVRDDHGPAPDLPGWHLDLAFPLDGEGRRIPGAAWFQVANRPGTSKEPAVMAFTCASAGLSMETWQRATREYGAMQHVLAPCGLWKPPAALPPPVPWLAVWLLPFMALVPPAAMLRFGEMEQGVAWAVAAEAAA